MRKNDDIPRLQAEELRRRSREVRARSTQFRDKAARLLEVGPPRVGILHHRVRKKRNSILDSDRDDSYYGLVGSAQHGLFSVPALTACSLHWGRPLVFSRLMAVRSSPVGPVAISIRPSDT